MDRLTIASTAHSKIFESMFFFKKLLEVIMHDEPSKYIGSVQNFSDEYIVKHFKFEEEKIFPLILRDKNTPQKRLVQDLQKEHTQILDTLDEFNKKISFYAPHPSRGEVKRIIQLIEPVTSMVLLHTRKEDEQLFPAVKDILSEYLRS